MVDFYRATLCKAWYMPSTCVWWSVCVCVSTAPIFTIFLPNGRYLCEFCWSGPVFRFFKGRCHGNRTLPWQPVLFCTGLGAEVSQDPLDRFSQSLHCMVGIEWQMINPTFFFQYLKGRCHGSQFSGKNGAKLLTHWTYRSVIPKRNGISPCEYAH